MGVNLSDADQRVQFEYAYSWDRPTAGHRVVTSFDIERSRGYTDCLAFRRGMGFVSTSPRVTDAVQLLKGLFLDVPGTQLSAVEAARLSGLDKSTCTVVLEAVEDANFWPDRGTDCLSVGYRVHPLPTDELEI
jgi:hypothetical protein